MKRDNGGALKASSACLLGSPPGCLPIQEVVHGLVALAGGDHLQKQRVAHGGPQADLLVIDDLGTEPMRKNVTKEYLLILLNERIAKGKSTIITTNLNPEQVLEKYEERIFSRMFNKRETLILQFVGKNQRLKRK